MPVDVNVGKLKPLDVDEMISELKSLFQKIIFLEATEIAEKVGEPKAMNSVMLGALAATGKLPLSIEKFKEAIEARLPKRVIKINLESFDQGYQKITKKG